MPALRAIAAILSTLSLGGARVRPPGTQPAIRTTGPQIAATPPGRQSTGQASAAPAAGLGVRVYPDTVLIGMPFHLMIRVHAPRGSVVTFPTGPDSGAAVEALDSRAIRTLPDSSATDVTASYRLAAWNLGRLPVAIGDVTVEQRGFRRTIPLGALSVVVVSVLPDRTGRHAPRPARALYPGHVPWWWWWAVAFAAIVALGLLWLIIRWWRRRSRRGPGTLSPLASAERDFAELDALGLRDAGEWGRYVALLAEIVRSYLSRRIQSAPMSATSGELLEALRADARIPIERLRAFLVAADLVKFAQQPVGDDRLQAAATAARSLVADVDAAADAAEMEARAAAARQIAQEFEERRAARAVGPRGRAA